MTKTTGQFERSGQSKNQVFHRWANRWATWDNILNTTYSSNEVFIITCGLNYANYYRERVFKE